MKSKLLTAVAIITASCVFYSESVIATPDGTDVQIRRDAAVQAIEKAMPSVVNISTETVVEQRNPFDSIWEDFFGRYYGRQKDIRYSLGSGVIVNEEGYILTNLHVVQRATKIWVSLSDGRKLEAETIASLSSSDIALLKLKTENKEKFVPIHFAAQDDLYLGETVIALGNPFGLGGSVSKGILSSKNRRPLAEDSDLDIQDWLQIDAAINPGNSGGPLINLNGDLIGLNVAIYRQGDGIGFAIPIKAVSEALSHILTPENVSQLWFGGILEEKQGTLTFKSVEAGSPAAQSGILAEDILLQINKTDVTDLFSANNLIAQSSAKSKPITLSLKRNGKPLTISTKLVPQSEYFNEKYIYRCLGIKVEKLTKETAETLGIQMMNAFAIMEIKSGTQAEKVGLRPGMLIYGIEGTQVSSVLEFARTLYLKPKDSKVRLNINIQRRTGNFIESRNAEIELPVLK
jgi:S1-C subfamily serine protease